MVTKQSDRENISLQSRPLHKMFSDVPHRYDIMNRLLTLRFDELWRKKAAKECMRTSPHKVMDLCTGTGDLALWLDKYAKQGTEIIGLDFSEPMLEVARDKASGRLPNRIQFILGDVSALPFPNGTIEVIGIAFAFRNLTYLNPKRELYLKEIVRVIKPGGKFVIVETSQPKSALLKSMVHLYMKAIVGGFGGFISGHKGAYRYLAQSAINFYDPDKMSALLVDSGFGKVTCKRLLGGVAAIFIAIK